MPTALTLDDASVLLIWTAVVLYALSFIAYAVDLGARSAAATDAKDAAGRGEQARELVGAGAAAGGAGAGAGAGSVSVEFGDRVTATAVAQKTAKAFRATAGLWILWQLAQPFILRLLGGILP